MGYEYFDHLGFDFGFCISGNSCLQCGDSVTRKKTQLCYKMWYKFLTGSREKLLKNTLNQHLKHLNKENIGALRGNPRVLAVSVGVLVAGMAIIVAADAGAIKGQGYSVIWLFLGPPPNVV